MVEYQAVAEEIYQVSLPIPFALRQVNCYLLRGNHGWSIVDTGLNTPDIQQGWQEVFAALQIRSNDIEQIILTHGHPDHYGFAGWLQAWSGAPVLMSARDSEMADRVWRLKEQPAGELGQAMVNELPDEVREAAAKASQHVREMTKPHPNQVEFIPYESALEIGSRQFKVIHAPGHSDGHILFYEPTEKLILCGDQVLMKITPNIGLWPLSEANPLGRYLGSLAELKGLDVALGLPGHRAVITNWAERIGQIEEHHAHRLELMLTAIEAGSHKLYDVCAAAFNVENFSEHDIRFAMAETLAHLDHMVHNGLIEQTRNGSWRYYRV